MIIEIPCRTDLTHYEFTQVLDGVAYKLVFRWNIRDESWYLDISLEDDTIVANSLKVVIEWPLLRSVHHTNRPLGELVAIDTSGSKIDATIDTLGSRVKLYYFDVSGIEALAEGL